MDPPTGGHTATSEDWIVGRIGAARLTWEWDLSPDDRASCLERVNLLVCQAIDACPDALTTVVAGWLSYAMVKMAEMILAVEQFAALDPFAFREGLVWFDI